MGIVFLGLFIVFCVATEYAAYLMEQRVAHRAQKAQQVAKRAQEGRWPRLLASSDDTDTYYATVNVK